MRLKSLRIRGIGAVRDSSLPIEDLDSTDRIVAIRGVNGSGKTTHIECVPGIVYGEVPSHGKLAAMANDAKSMVAAVIETDREYRLQRDINANRKTPAVEAYLFDEDGTPLNDGKQTTFNEMVKKLFPPQNLYLASGFLAQKHGGQFLELPKSERKSLFVEMLGAGYLQKLSEAAGLKSRSMNAEIERLHGRASALRDAVANIPAAESRFATATQQHSEAAEELKKAEDAEAKRATLMDEWLSADRELTKAVHSAESLVSTAKQAARVGESELSKLRSRLATTAAETAKLSVRTAAEKDLRVRVSDGEKARESMLALQAERDKATVAREAWSADHREWAVQESKLRSAYDNARAEYKERVTAAATKREQLKKDAIRLKSQASKLGDVPCRGEGEYAACPLIEMAAKARDESDGIDALIAGADSELELAKGDTGTGQALRDELDSHMKLEPAEPPRFAGDEGIDGLRAIAVAGEEAAVELAALAEVNAQIEKLRADAAELRDQVDGATTQLKALEQAVEDADRVRSSAQSEWSTHQDEKPQVPDDGLLDRMRKAESDAASEVARSDEALKATKDAKAQLVSVEVEIATASTEVDDWRHLQKAFGRDGIQALEVDAAGPEVSGLINTLLHSCFGSRFSCRLETTALKSTGGGTKEIFDLVVIDSDMGREGSASDLSGGERVIVSEALSLAIAIFNASKSDIPILDLWRDEVAGALDLENARRYLVMLRRALEIGGFHRIYFIAHSPDLWDQADKVISVVDGVAEVAA